MFVTTVACGPLEANCYLVATQEGADCVIIDAGMEAAIALPPLLERYRLTPVAVLSTHGHIDHVGDAAAVAGAYDIPVYIHPADAHLLSDPAAGLGPELARWLAPVLGEVAVPARVEALDAPGVRLAGLDITVIPAPGHTPGSVLLRVDDHVFTGDVVFAGSIGRTDLPGGDPAAMAATLHAVLELEDGVRLLPGHGAATTVAAERATNPYLSPRFLD